MSWSSGSSLFSQVIRSVETIIGEDKSLLSYENAVFLYKYLIEDFKDYDCDTLDECLGQSKAFDQAYKEFYN